MDGTSPRLSAPRKMSIVEQTIHEEDEGYDFQFQDEPRGDDAEKPWAAHDSPLPQARTASHIYLMGGAGDVDWRGVMSEDEVLARVVTEALLNYYDVRPPFMILTSRVASKSCLIISTVERSTDRTRLSWPCFHPPSRRLASFPSSTKEFQASYSSSLLPTTSSILLYVSRAIHTRPALTSPSCAGGVRPKIRTEHRIHPREWDAERARFCRRCALLRRFTYRSAPLTFPPLRSRKAGLRLPDLARASHTSPRRDLSARTHSRVFYASRAAQAGTPFRSALILRNEANLLFTLKAPMLDVGDSCLESLRDVLDDVLDYSKFR